MIQETYVAYCFEQPEGHIKEVDDRSKQLASVKFSGDSLSFHLLAVLGKTCNPVRRIRCSNRCFRFAALGEVRCCAYFRLNHPQIG